MIRPLVPDRVAARIDVIIVLGAPVAADGRLGASARERVEAGVAAWRAGVAPWLLFTGGRTDPSPWSDLRAGLWGLGAVERSERTEAAAMRDHASALGVPDEAILVEDQARSTEENARFAADMMRSRGLTHALLVTQPYHLRRSLAHFDRLGVAAAPLHVEQSHVYRGDWSSLRSLRWVSREYIIIGLEALQRRRHRGR